MGTQGGDVVLSHIIGAALLASIIVSAALAGWVLFTSADPADEELGDEHYGRWDR